MFPTKPKALARAEAESNLQPGDAPASAICLGAFCRRDDRSHTRAAPKMGRIGSKASVPLTLPEEGGVSAHVMQRRSFAPRQHFTCVFLAVLLSLALSAAESSSATFLASNQSSTRRYLALRSLTGKGSPWPLASLLGTCHREPTNPHGCRALPLPLGNSGDLCAVTGYQPYTTTCGACWKSTHRLSAVQRVWAIAHPASKELACSENNLLHKRTQIETTGWSPPGPSAGDSSGMTSGTPPQPELKKRALEGHASPASMQVVADQAGLAPRPPAMAVVGASGEGRGASSSAPIPLQMNVGDGATQPRRPREPYLRSRPPSTRWPAD